MHTLPVLAAVEQDLAGDPVVVIGVHSPKFPGEGDEEAVRQALVRHGVTHPVVVDTEHRIWDAFAVKAWPTLVVVGPDGVIVGSASGEPEHLTLTATLRGILGNAAGQLRGGPLPLRRQSPPPGPLAFPGGIATAPDETIYVADTGHHQIVECSTDGVVRRRLGRGRADLLDGPASASAFHHPRGLALDGGRLLVADTGNHAVRSVDLATGDVTTLAGTGRRGRDPQPGPARRVDLRSPWDLVVLGDGALVVSMAGSHQLWGVQDGIAAPYAGTGREARVDADLGTAAFAQPSGLCAVPGAGAGPASGGPLLYVADSENSAIRLVADGQVRTVAGGNLFTWGLEDDRGDDARFQHPVGVAWDGADILVADTLNHALRRMSPEGEVRTVVLDEALDAPEALAVEATGAVLVADTGTHRVLRVDLGSGRCNVVLGGGRDTEQECVKFPDALPTEGT